MKFGKTAAAASMIAMLSAQAASACTGVIIGKAVTATGASIISRNEDVSTNNWVKHMVVHAPETHEKGDVWAFETGLTVPKPAKTLGYTAMPDHDGFTKGSGAGPFEEVGVNTANVAFSATFSADLNDKAAKADPQISGGIDESVVTTLVLSQATSAKNAVELLGSLIEQYGSAETGGISISDTDGAWYFEFAGGHQWIAVRVPDDAYLVQANALRIHDVDLDSVDVMHSAGLFDFVQQHKLLEKPDAKSFNFAKAFGVTGDSYSTDRIWLAQHILSPDVKQDVRQDQYPLFMYPDHKIGVEDVATMLRANYKGTELEGKKDLRVIGIDRNVESHIIEMRDNMPDPITAVIWQSIGNVSGSMYVPFYGGITEVPAAYSVGGDQYAEGSAWWQYRMVSALTTVNGGVYRDGVMQARDEAEGNMVKALPHLDQAIKAMAKEDPALAAWYANYQSNAFALEGVNMYKKLGEELITQITKSTEKDYSPEEWAKIKAL